MNEIPVPVFEYASEEIGEAFTEWCAAKGVEARDDQEYRWLRQAFTAGMNEVCRYANNSATFRDLVADQVAEAFETPPELRQAWDEIRTAVTSQKDAMIEEESSDW